jgi:hypothetical protein
MNTAYTVTVLHDGSFSCHQRIELEVRFARELERLLGGADQVVRVCRAAFRPEGVKADAHRWTKAFDDAVLVVRQEAALADVQFRVLLDDAPSQGTGR